MNENCPTFVYNLSACIAKLAYALCVWIFMVGWTDMTNRLMGYLWPCCRQRTINLMALLQADMSVA